MGTLVNYGTPDNLNVFKHNCSIVSDTNIKYILENDIIVTVKSKKKTKNNGITIIACHIGNEVSAPLNKVVIPFNIAYQAIGTLRGFLNPTIQYNFKGELRENQRMDFDIILEKINASGSCLFLAYPGYGKTFLMMYFIAHFKAKAIILVPTMPLMMQVYNIIKRVLTDDVQILGLDHVIKDDNKVLICLRGRLNAPSELFRSYEFVIIDEIHMQTTIDGIAGLLTLRPRRILALTATVGNRNAITEKFIGGYVKSQNFKMWNITFPIFKPSNIAIDNGIKGYTKAITDLTRSESYIDSMLKLVMYFVKTNNKVMLIDMRNQLTFDIMEKLLERSITVDYIDSSKKSCINSQVLIGTYKIMGTGFDEENYITGDEYSLSNVLIFMGSIKDFTLMYQISGRIFRCDRPLVIYPSIVDIPFSLNHRRKLIEYCKEIPGCNIRYEYEKFLEFLMR